uniref:Putative peptidase n=1 Tax=viral metagenome TaxID=1070528 RepID=A0A6M3J9I8_9ZZZZ
MGVGAVDGANDEGSVISTKLGIHVIGGTALALGRPRVIKLVDPSVVYVRQVRALVGPDCLIIVRWVETGLLDRGADVWFFRHIAQMQAMSAGDPRVCFESANEIADSDAPRYSVWELARMRLMHTHGLRSVLGNWSVGVPDLPVWQMYRPILNEMRPGVDSDLVGLHEYWSDYADISNRWHCGRWTMVPELAGKQIVVTECGRDQVEGHGQAGWKLSCDAPTYLGDLRCYSRLLDAHPNVAGGLVFQVGAISHEWQPFDLTAIWPQVVSEYEGVPMPQPTIVLAHPLRKPRITQRFAENPNMYGYGPAGHPGQDYSCPEGTVVRAPCSGECYPGNPTGAYAAYGEHLWIKGDDQGRTYWVILAHLIRVLADKGDRVEAGNIVALSGSTGNSTAPHLHLGIETTEQNPGFQDRHDLGFYWQTPQSLMQV